MSKWKRTRRSLIAAVVSMSLCLTMLFGTTLAWFSDNTANVRNKIVAGTLDVEFYNTTDGGQTPVEGNASLFGEDSIWEPGEAKWVNLRIENTGTLALKYQLRINIAEETGSVNVLGADFNLSDYMHYAVVDGRQTYADSAAAIAAAESVGTVKISEGDLSVENTLYPPEKATEEVPSARDVTLIVYMEADDANNANARDGAPVPQIDLGVILSATQTSCESDGFDAQYDAFTPVYDADGLRSALQKGGTVMLMNSVDLNEAEDDCDVGAWDIAYSEISITGDSVLDLNGNTLSVRGSVFVSSGATAVIRNGALEYKPCEHMIEKNDNHPLLRVGNANLTLENVEIGEVMGGQHSVEISNEGYIDSNDWPSNNGNTALTIKGGTIKGVVGLYQSGDYQLNVIVDEGTVISNAGSNAFYTSNAANLTINGGQFHCEYLINVDRNMSGSVTVNGGTFILSGAVLSGSGRNNDFEKVTTDGTLNSGEFSFTVSNE